MSHWIVDDHAAALLRAVLDDPGDDLPRLILADRIEELGRGDRAEFIRLQCELARAGDEARRCSDAPDHRPCRWCTLRRRERDLLWGLPSELPVRHAAWPAPATGGAADIEPMAVYGRGFAESVTLPAAEWLRHAGRIMAAHPVRELHLTGCAGRAAAADQSREQFAGRWGPVVPQLRRLGRVTVDAAGWFLDGFGGLLPGLAVEWRQPRPGTLALPDVLPRGEGQVIRDDCGRRIGVVTGVDEATGTVFLNATPAP
jgi:uncharacterized protein (TIGR02996 family)